MSGSITLTAAMRANLLSLQQTGNLLSTTQLDLSTGNKVNSALDNPVNFFAAQSLNRRASQLSALLDGMGQAIQTIQAANQGITSITGLVNQLTSIANSATQDLATKTTQDILAPTAASGGLDSADVADLTNASAANAISAGDSFSLQDGSGPAVSFTIDTTANGGTGTSLQDVADAINKTAGFQATVVYGDGTNTLPDGTTKMTAGLAYLEVTSTDNQTITAKNINGSDILTALGFATTSAAYTTGGATADVTNYTNVLNQINALASNSNYQGNNLINGTGADMTVQVNELSTNAITVKSVDSTTTGLKLSALTGTTSGIATAISQINAALSTLQTQASGFANNLSLIQNRQDFTSNLINTLQSGASALTIADKNEEGANMLALQTQQQLGIEALSLSSQANQSVLRLFA